TGSPPPPKTKSSPTSNGSASSANSTPCNGSETKRPHRPKNLANLKPGTVHIGYPGSRRLFLLPNNLVDAPRPTSESLLMPRSVRILLPIAMILLGAACAAVSVRGLMQTFRQNGSSFRGP